MTDAQDYLIVRHRAWIERSLRKFAERTSLTEQELAYTEGLLQQADAIDNGDWKQAFCLEVECNALASKITPSAEEASQN
jgi:hypothetical protein